MSFIRLVALSLLLTSCLLSEAHKILVIFPVPAKSHGILGTGVVKHLLAAGHEVTYITPFPTKEGPNLHIVQDVAPTKEFNENSMNLQQILDKQIDFTDKDFIMQLLNNVATAAVSDDNVQKLLRDPKQQFDVVVAEWMFSELYAGISAIYGCPLIWVSTLDPHWLIMSLIDETLNPAYSADYVSSYTVPFTFSQRLDELMTQITGQLRRVNKIVPQEEKAYNKYIVPIIKERGMPVPLYEDVRYNISLVLGNSHVSLGLPTRLPQSYKPIGGYHIDTNVDPLPADLQKLMDESKHGVIYFSMGSNLKSKNMPEKLKLDLLKMFSSLKQTVLWKFEEVLPNLPKNVRILQWAPQPSILSHNNCVLFITHGGLLSSTEAVHFGVPIIGIPVFADQFSNVNKAINKGFAKRIDLSYDMADDLKEAIEDIISDPKYSEKVKELSFIYHHRPVSPGAELVHWVDHVVRTRGAPHLRAPAIMVPWYQKLYLDLISLIILALIIIKIVITRLISKLRSPSSLKKKKQ